MIPNALTIHKLKKKKPIIEPSVTKNFLYDDLKSKDLDVEDRKYHYFSIRTKEEQMCICVLCVYVPLTHETQFCSSIEVTCPYCTVILPSISLTNGLTLLQ